MHRPSIPPRDRDDAHQPQGNMMSATVKARVREGLPHPLRRHLGRQGRQFRAVLGPRDQGRALPVRRSGRARDRAHRAARIHRRDLARLRARTSARRRSMATACTGPTSRTQGHRFNPNKLLLDPYARGHVGELTWDPGGLRLSARRSGDDLPSTSATARPSCRNASSSIRISTGSEEPARRPVPWDRTIIYETHVRGFTMLPSEDAGSSSAAPSRVSRPRR